MRRQQRTALAIAAVLAMACGAAASQAAARGAGPVRTAHAAAQAGYEAYAARDFAAATQYARRAVQFAPGRRDYWLLLAQSQLAQGQVDAAGQSIERAAQAKGDPAALDRARADVARARARPAGEAMYRALQDGDVQAAISQGEQAVRHAPDNAGYRLVLVHALLRDRRYADAERRASETIALLPESAAPLALRAYARQGMEHPTEAAADIDRAIRQRGLDSAAQRQLRLLAADLALAQADGQRAVDALQPLPDDDAEALARRDLARQRMVGAAAAPFVLGAPAIDCSNVEAAQTCVVQAVGLPGAPGFVNATAAYRALEEREPQRALQQARLATAASPGRSDWHRMHMNAALAAGEPAEAERAASAALALGPDPATLARRSSIRRQLGDAVGASADAEAALESGQLPAATEASLLADLGRTREAQVRLAVASAAATTPQARLDMGYLSARLGDDEAARLAFQAADGSGGLPATSLMDAGYAAMRSHHDEDAVAYFKRAIDASDGVQLKMSPQMVYDTRRTIADISRKWGVLASLTARNGGGITPGFGAVGGPDGHRATQAGVEAYYRPWGFRNGQFVELFTRGFVTLDSQAGDPTGRDSFQGGVGVRWKPLTQHNLVLSMSRVFGPNVEGDWLAQVGYSLDLGTDLRMEESSWWTARVYAEAGRYLEQGNRYGVASLMAGRSYKVGEGGRTVLFPHGFVGVEYSSSDPVAKTAAGVGPGVTLRRWFREDTYDAPRSYWDLTVQYRARLAGDDRMRGLFVNGLLSF